MEEIRKDVVWYEGKYMVSNIWRVKSLDRDIVWWMYWHRSLLGKLLRNKTDNNWYISILLSTQKIKIRYRVHRLVAQAFIPNTENKKEVNHKNWIKTDNNIGNLEWVTHKENEKHSYAILNKKPTREKRYWVNHCRSKKIWQYRKNWEFVRSWDNGRDVERILWFMHQWISACCLCKRDTYRGFIRKYI